MGQVLARDDRPRRGCTYWTSEGETAIKAGKLAKWFDKNISQLNDLTDLVRGKLSRQERGTLGALIVIDVHARDVVTLLQNQKVTALSDFDWVAQLRYYWESKEDDALATRRAERQDGPGIPAVRLRVPG